MKFVFNFFSLFFFSLDFSFLICREPDEILALNHKRERLFRSWKYFQKIYCAMQVRLAAQRWTNVCLCQFSWEFFYFWHSLWNLIHRYLCDLEFSHWIDCSNLIVFYFSLETPTKMYLFLNEILILIIECRTKNIFQLN